ncbi:hypothetical protein CY35_02G145500 [Sphagnum magellanicum]|nr:hypothetical protein CY35_02G145500 [Sphagnum magellanicum]
MELQYRGKHILAPIVCGGTLPFRMLAAKYGAGVTYGEEIVDHRLLRSTRKINKMLGTVDSALQAANLVSGDIKSCSPSVILTTLERSLNIPVTCKIHLLKTHHDTVELAGRIEKIGVAAIAVHGRGGVSFVHSCYCQW